MKIQDSLVVGSRWIVHRNKNAPSFFTPHCAGTRHAQSCLLGSWLQGAFYCVYLSALEASRKQPFWLSHCDQNCQILSKKCEISFYSKRLIYISFGYANEMYFKIENDKNQMTQNT